MSALPPSANAAGSVWNERNQRLSALLARVALGDRAAFEAVYRDTGSFLFGVVLRVLHDRGQAEDVLQEVYVKVWRAAGSFDAARSQPLTWLTHVARHSAIDGLRRAKTEPDTVSLAHDGDDGAEDRDGLDELPDPGDGPLEQLQRSAEAHEVTACLEVLSPEQQQCLALAYYSGLSHSETAEHLRQPLGTVKSWVRRALLALRDCLARAGIAQAN
jgi:RNA polymerase sigma-70 factor, ECF subfamily